VRALPGLLPLLGDKNRSTRLYAATALLRLDPTQTRCVEILKNALKSRESGYRHLAAQSIAALGPAGAFAAEDLFSLLNDRKGYVRKAAVEALSRIGRAAVPYLVRGLKNRKRETRRRSVEALLRMEKGAGGAVEALSQSLSDPDPEVRRSAAGALAVLGAEAKTAAPRLVEALKDKDGYVRATAAFALGRIGRAAERSVPFLIELLADKSPGEPPPEATGRPKSRTAPPPHPVAYWACEALSGIGSGAVPALVAAYTDKRTSIRVYVLKALGRMHPPAAQAVPVIIDGLKDHDYHVRREAVAALRRLGEAGAPALSLALRALESSDPAVRLAGITIGAALGHAASPALSRIKVFLKEGDFEFRLSAARAVLRIDPADGEAAELLCNAVHSELGRRCLAAARAVAETRPPCRDAAWDLFRLLEVNLSRDQEMRDACADALVALGEGSVDALRIMLRKSSEEKREAAAILLGEIGRPARRAACELALLLKEKDHRIASVAAESLLSVLWGK